MNDPLIVSTGTLVTALVGLVIAAVYLRQMGRALAKSVRTRHAADDHGEDRFRRGLIGAVISVLLSILSIAVFGLGAAFLYWGPVLALIAAAAVAYSLGEEAAGS